MPSKSICSVMQVLQLNRLNISRQDIFKLKILLTRKLWKPTVSVFFKYSVHLNTKLVLYSNGIWVLDNKMWQLIACPVSTDFNKVQWGSENRPFKIQNHSKTGHFEGRFSNGRGHRFGYGMVPTIRKPDYLASLDYFIWKEKLL